MPYIHLRTNVTIDKDKVLLLKARMGQDIVDLPGKSEHWLIAEIEGAKDLFFQGTKDPCAMIEVQLYGKADRRSKETLSRHLTGLCQDLLGIDEDRVYVSFVETPDWAYAGSLF